MNKRLSVDSLRVFRTVVQTGSMSKTASLLSLSQSAVSWKLRRLEDQLQCQLLTRHAGKACPTEKGSVLLQHAVKILSEHDNAVAYFSPSALRGKLRVGVTEHISLTEVCSVIALFTHHHPEVDVQLVVEQSHLLRQHFSEGGLDIILHQDFTGMASGEDKVLWTEKLYWCAPPSWRYASGNRLKLITWGTDCFYRRMAEEKLNQADITFMVMLECPSVAGMLAAINAGLGVGIMNEFSIAKPVSDLCELEQRMPLPSVDCLLRVNEHRYNPASEAFCLILSRLMQRSAKAGDINSSQS
ncbi:MULTISPECIES: LysR family transcriptional regulator [Rahnella]|mgnify:CR=1 FL=1|jgi:DNA-binding transcriptional LysR family regulator|uniref:LysR family transcriptional regulator n=2 Tax=Rahnella sp. (strain Y9602) TaxID=2703885 RepID=A0A0H3FH57_RAHSY|nr:MULTISPECIES: LysR family transcriptional regulator [Rahnella]AYA09637.1 LysR family transcriptional regulator [Rahnella aquatilis]ADW76459.1 transcriptional regulator, LysR family [Rahnella aceris]MBU9842903.1 LysR family transcriptional regulator [Rahnella aceris]MBU9851815.1 LysR family transcriptional regulator [Rahnella aceris]MBU9866602.1 LysR family transcriptional regulator [Rahnella aceris]